MRWTLMSIYDSAVQNYSPPFCVRALGEAFRTFEREVKNPQSRISLSPADYTLFHLGFFDDETAKIEFLPAPARIISGHEVGQSAPEAPHS